MNLIRKMLFVLYLIIFIGCENYLDTDPVDTVIFENVVINEETAFSLLYGLYADMGLTGIRGDNLLGDFANMSDEQNSTFPNEQYTLNAVDPETIETFPWRRLWNSVKDTNNALEIFEDSDTITEELASQFIAETSCIRAYNYLLLTQFWGDVPFSESTDFQVLNNLSRTSVSDIHASLLIDISGLLDDLPDSFGDETANRTRFTRGAAQALLARIALYARKWDLAETNASQVIANPLYELQADYLSVFTPLSGESIFELQSDGNPENHFAPVSSFFPTSLGGELSFVPTKKILNSFEAGDSRFSMSIAVDATGINYVNKYRDIEITGLFNELKLFRLAEQYLIRAEARVGLGDLAGATADINVIRNRAGLPNTTASDAASLLLAIEQERFVELCFEGHRFTDLVRTGRADGVLGQFNPTWKPRAKLLPIPQEDIDRNPNLSQNPAY